MICLLAPAKVNIVLKISGKKGDFHTLQSRFVLFETLSDKIYIQENKILKSESKEFDAIFDIKGDCNCKAQDNTIYKAYKALYEHANTYQKEKINTFLRGKVVEVQKAIPIGGGLGGGSSNSASFLNFLNSHLKLGISQKELMNIGLIVGSDVPFFVSKYKSANVFGIGDIIEEYKENKEYNIQIKNTNIHCNSAKIYKHFRDKFYKQSDIKELLKKDSLDILGKLNPLEANDLFAPAMDLYPNLKQYIKEGWFLSGSGGSFFKLNPI